MWLNFLSVIRIRELSAFIFGLWLLIDTIPDFFEVFGMIQYEKSYFALVQPQQEYSPVL
jgi:hypothetical protein